MRKTDENHRQFALLKRFAIFETGLNGKFLQVEQWKWGKNAFFPPCREMCLSNERLKIANIKSAASAAALRVAGGGVVLGGGEAGGRSQSWPSLAQRWGVGLGRSQPWQAAQFIAHRNKQPFTLGHLRTI